MDTSYPFDADGRRDGPTVDPLGTGDVEMAYRCGACRRVRARLHELALERELPDVRVRLLVCGACGAAKAFLVGIDPWRGPELEAMGLRAPGEARGDGLLEVAEDLLGRTPSVEEGGGR